jgi:hypothetical protein
VGDDKADELAARDAGVGRKVMLTHYVRVLREKSNRTFCRILAGLSPEVARRYGDAPAEEPTLEEQLRLVFAAKDWEEVARLSAQLTRTQEPPAA